MDLSHKLTDDELAELEREISEVYERSTGEISEKWRAHMDKVRARAAEAERKIQKAATDEEKAAAVEDYKRILRNATLQNKHYAEMIDETTTRLSHVNEIALDYANERMPKVYTINYNGESEGFCEAVAGYSFTMCDEGTIRYLINNNKLLLPPKKLDPVKDKAWNTKKLNAEVLQGIIQGESVGKIADRVERVTEANRVSALRAARTLTTGAENKGRLDSYTNAERMGIKLKKRWMAAMDNRTRHTHRMLDGQMRDRDKPFEVGGRSIMYPGDPDAAPDLVYNCRCTMVAEAEGTSSYPLKPEGKPAWADGMTDEEYAEWKSEKVLTTASPGNIIKTGARNPYGKAATKHAEQYYEFIRNIDTDVNRIAKNTGIDELEILEIKKFLFTDLHNLGGEMRRFDPDFMIAQSWQRLIDGKRILKHDKTLLLHEQFEKSLMKDGFSQEAAHIKASEKYNYGKEAEKYYASIKKYKKER